MPFFLQLTSLTGTAEKRQRQKLPRAYLFSFTHFTQKAVKALMCIFRIKQTYPFSNNFCRSSFNSKRVTILPWKLDHFIFSFVSRSYVYWLQLRSLKCHVASLQKQMNCGEFPYNCIFVYTFEGELQTSGHQKFTRVLLLKHQRLRASLNFHFS